MINNYEIDCSSPLRPLPLRTACQSARTIGIRNIPSGKMGVTLTGVSVRIVNADGTSLIKAATQKGRDWVVTFPASHFTNYGSIKNGLAVIIAGTDETGAEQIWVQAVADIEIVATTSSATPGTGGVGGDVYLKSYIDGDGVQHYRLAQLVWSERQQDYGYESSGDYILVGGEFTPYTESET